MYPSVFESVKDNTIVKSKLGTNPVRVFPFGRAPDAVEKPYAVWQIITGEPENYISGSPDLDSFVVQFNVYGNTPTQAREAAEALRDAIEAVAHIVSWRGENQEPETKLFGYSFDANFLTNR